MAPWSSPAEPWLPCRRRWSRCARQRGDPFAGHGQAPIPGCCWTHRVEWSRVAGFEVPPPYGTLLKSGIRVRLHGGRLLSANACAYGGIDEFAFVKTRRARVIEEL